MVGCESDRRVFFEANNLNDERRNNMIQTAPRKIELINIPESLMRGTKPNVTVTPNCWIAGGAIRAWFTGSEKSRDIDVFGTDVASISDLLQKNKLDRVLDKSPHATTYAHRPFPVQAIWFTKGSVAELLESFDFSLCQFAWDGESIFSTVEAVTSVLRRHLGIARIQPGFEMDSLRRAFKYQAKGFKPCLGTLRDLANSIRSIPQEDIERQIEISPNGMTRGTIRWD